MSISNSKVGRNMCYAKFLEYHRCVKPSSRICASVEADYDMEHC